MARYAAGGIEVRDRVGASAAVTAVMRCFLSVPGADPALVERITVSPKRVGSVHGRCRFPRPSRGGTPGRELRQHGYVVTAAVRVDADAYPLAFAHWGALRAPKTKQGWRSGSVLYGFEGKEAAAGFVVAHELAHVALRQKWLKAKNTEAVTNALALHWCEQSGLDVEARPADRRRRLVPPSDVLALERPRQLWLW